MKAWQVDGAALLLVLENSFLTDGLEKNADWLLARLRNWIPDLERLTLSVETKEEAALEDWESQKAVWLEIFKGR